MNMIGERWIWDYLGNGKHCTFLETIENGDQGIKAKIIQVQVSPPYNASGDRVNTVHILGKTCSMPKLLKGQGAQKEIE